MYILFYMYTCILFSSTYFIVFDVHVLQTHLNELIVAVKKGHYNNFTSLLLNPLTAKLFNLNFHPLEVVSR